MFGLYPDPREMFGVIYRSFPSNMVVLDACSYRARPVGSPVTGGGGSTHCGTPFGSSPSSVVPPSVSAVMMTAPTAVAAAPLAPLAPVALMPLAPVASVASVTPPVAVSRGGDGAASLSAGAAYGDNSTELPAAYALLVHVKFLRELLRAVIEPIPVQCVSGFPALTASQRAHLASQAPRTPITKDDLIVAFKDSQWLTMLHADSWHELHRNIFVDIVHYRHDPDGKMHPAVLQFAGIFVSLVRLILLSLILLISSRSRRSLPGSNARSFLFGLTPRKRSFC